MKLNRLNLVTALISLGAAGVWLTIGQDVTGVIWLVCGLVWLTLAVTHFQSPAGEPNPVIRFVRRLSRMLLWS
ncbi:MAG: hypothetical protein NTY38_14995 [Acidobacteria bacterium]|nr:hypothetical protein [Acidobacteriota bacterium]